MGRAVFVLCVCAALLFAADNLLHCPVLALAYAISAAHARLHANAGNSGAHASTFRSRDAVAVATVEVARCDVAPSVALAVATPRVWATPRASHRRRSHRPLAVEGVAVAAVEVARRRVTFVVAHVIAHPRLLAPWRTKSFAVATIADTLLRAALGVALACAWRADGGTVALP